MERLLSVSEAAEYLGIKKATIYKFVRLQRLPVTRIGTRILFDPSSLKDWVKKNTLEPLEETPKGAS